MINNQNNRNHYLQILTWLSIGIILGSLVGGTYIHNLNSNVSNSTDDSNFFHYYAFVFNGHGSNVSVIDRISKTLLYSQNLNIEYDNIDALLNPVSNYLYIVSVDNSVHNSNVYVLDSTNFDIKYIIPAGKNLQHGGVITNNGELLLIVNREDNSLILIDTVKNIVVERIKVGKNPHDVELSNNNNYAYISNTESRSISIIDINNKIIIDEISLNIEPWMLIFFKNNNNLIVTSGNPNSIVELNLKNHSVDNLLMLSSEPHGISLSEKNNFVLIALPNENVVAVVDLNDFNIIKKIDVGDYPYQLNISPDESYAYVLNTGSDNVSVIDLEQLNVVSTIAVGQGPTDVLFYLPNSDSNVQSNSDNDDSENEFDAARFTCGAYIHVRD